MRKTFNNRIYSILTNKSNKLIKMNNKSNKSIKMNNKSNKSYNQFKVIGKQITYRKEKYKKGYLNSVKTKTVVPYYPVGNVTFYK